MFSGSATYILHTRSTKTSIQVAEPKTASELLLNNL